MIISVYDRDDNDNAKTVLVTLSSFSVVNYNIATTVFENSLEGKSIGDFIYGRTYTNSIREESNYLRNYDTNAPKASIARKIFSSNKVKMLEVMEDSYYYIPQKGEQNPSVYDYNFEEKIYDYLEAADEKSSVTFINTTNKPCSTNKYILSRADKIIVVVKPNYHSISEFINEYKSIRSKCIFVIIRALFNKQEILKIKKCFNLNSNNLFIISKTEKFEEAAINGRIIDYIREHYADNRQSEEYNTIFSIRQLTKSLFSGKYEHLQGLSKKYSSLLR